MSSPVTMLPLYVSPRGAARWATATLALTVAAAWVAVGIELSQLRLLANAAGGTAIELEARDAQLYTNETLLWIQGILLAATGAAFLFWLFRARVNVRSFGARRLRYPRSWAWGGFLVPVVNLFRPYQVIREVWQASSPESLDPFNWRNLAPPPLLAIWWTSFVVWAVLQTLALMSHLGAGAHLPKLQLATVITALADVAAAGSAFLAIFVVARISDAQDSKRQALS